VDYIFTSLHFWKSKVGDELIRSYRLLNANAKSNDSVCDAWPLRYFPETNPFPQSRAKFSRTKSSAQKSRMEKPLGD